MPDNQNLDDVFIKPIKKNSWQILCFAIFYPLYYVFKIDFYHNPYLYDIRIRLPIYQAKKHLCELALKTPETANNFVTFLRTYHPLQSKLSDYITHAALAGTWLQSPLKIETLQEPIIENKKLKPSINWLNQLQTLKNESIIYEQQSNIQLKQQNRLRLINILDSFKQQTLLENPNWHGYYLKAIDSWLSIANEQLGQLKLQALIQEPIANNVYLPNVILNPTCHENIFFR